MIKINSKDRRVISLLNNKKELQFSDFQNIFKLSDFGIRKKIKEYISKSWIKVKDKQTITYTYIGDKLPELEE
jgi:hypothetical protein